MKISNIPRLLARKIADRGEFRSFEGLKLPLKRSNEGLSDDRAYLNSIVAQIEPISELISSRRILDFGCGQGRLLLGLRFMNLPFHSYSGVDVDARSIAWCCKYLADGDEQLSFLWYNARNDRYNPAGRERTLMPYPSGSSDFVFSNSVFSHLDADDSQFYLGEIARILETGGRAYITAFIEDDVESCSINPPDYGIRRETTPLHRVRFDRKFFFEMVGAAGLLVDEFRHRGVARTYQSELILTKS